MKTFTRFILRYAGLVALLGTLLAGAGAYYSVQLFKNLRTDIEELLPTTARAVVDLNEVTGRLEAIDNVAILVFSDHPQASKRFVIDLANRLQKVPRDVIASVEYRIDRELKFFKDRQALFMEVSDLERIREYIRERIEYEKQLYNPLNIFSQQEIPEPKLDFYALRQKYSGKTSSFEHFPDGFYATPDEKKRVVLAYLPGKSSGIAGAHRLKDEIVKAIDELNPKSYSSDIQIKYSGGVQDTLEEHAALIADLTLSTVIVAVLCMVAMLLFYRAARATFALLFSLFMGTFWTFGIAYFAVGYLNANSAFLGSIVIGNGINFGIIFLARYVEERRKGRDNTHALTISMNKTYVSTLTAALGAALSYGSLMLTSFRGFNQFGVIGLIGMILCWLSAYTLLPAYLTVFDRISPLIRKGSKAPKAWIVDALAWLVGKFAHPIWLLSFAGMIISVCMFYRLSPDILETNLGKLRNKESIERGSAYNSRYLDEIFQHYLSPIVILPKSRADARKIAALLKDRKDREGKSSMLASVQTLDEFIPQNQPEKIKLLREIQKLLPKRLFYRLSESDRQLVQKFLTPESMHPITEQDLPPMVKAKFTEKDGSIGKLVLVEPPLGGDVTWKGESLIELIRILRDTADSVSPGTAVAGTLPITSDMIKAITRDGPRATLFAFLAVVLLVIILFRNTETITLILFALFMGVLWLAGLILGFHFKINFLNFIALPITFGIGVDYGVNIFHRYREEGAANILNVIRSTGGAVLLSSFTTMVGYGSLLIAGNQGFVSFGTLAVGGELTCVTAAVISLPAFLLIRHRKRSVRSET